MSTLRALTVRMSDVKSRPVRWLWPQMIPRGKLTILCGDPGLGKSFVTLDVCARASRGGPWPLEAERVGGGGGCAPVGALLLSAEDDPGDTIRPRLEAMGADLSKVRVVDAMVDGRNQLYDFVIGEHARLLADLMEGDERVGLVVVDPVSAYVGGTDSYNNAQVRAMLKPLSDLAADHDVAVVLVTHLKKGEVVKTLHAAMGSLAFTAAARVVLMATRDPHRPDARLLLTVKSNLAKDRQGFRYAITDGAVEWLGTVEGQADEVLGGGGVGGGGGAQAFQPVSSSGAPSGFATLLREFLDTGPRSAGDVKAFAGTHGVGSTLLQRAKDSLNIQPRNVKGTWMWSLSAATEPIAEPRAESQAQPVIEPEIGPVAEPPARMPPLPGFFMVG